MDIKPSEIIFLDYISFRKTNDICYYGDLPNNISAVAEITKLKDMGLVEPHLDINKNISSLKVTNLKDILKTHNLSVVGKKAELVKRILENVEMNELSKIYDTKTYKLTSVGEQLIKDNYIYILNKNKHWGFSEKEIQVAYKNAKDWMSDNDILWSMLNTRNFKLINSGDWGMYSNNLLIMAQLLYSESKYEQALIFFVAVFCIDLSGMGNNNSVDTRDLIFVAPGVLDSIRDCISYLNLNLDSLGKEIEKSLPYRKSLPFCYYNDISLERILKDCLNGIDFDYRNYSPNRRPNKQSNTYQYYGHSTIDKYFREPVYNASKPTEQQLDTIKKTIERPKRVNIFKKLFQKLFK